MLGCAKKGSSDSYDFAVEDNFDDSVRSVRARVRGVRHVLFMWGTAAAARHTQKKKPDQLTHFPHFDYHTTLSRNPLKQRYLSGLSSSTVVRSVRPLVVRLYRQPQR